MADPTVRLNHRNISHVDIELRREQYTLTDVAILDISETGWLRDGVPLFVSVCPTSYVL
jgi:hypothetical protein